MDELKGEPRVLATFQSEARHVELMGYSDGGWGIRRDGRVVGTWEADEAEDCFNEFFELTGMPDKIIFRSEQRSILCSVHSQGPMN